MAYKDKLTQKIKLHEYYISHKKEFYARNRQWYANHSQQVSEKQRLRYKEKTEHVLAISRKSKRSLRLEVLNAYGNKCVCCGEDREPFLTIEHINGGGEMHRKKVNGEVYRDIKKNGFPREEYSILCWNCNCASRGGRICPHREIKLCALA